jgi:hypothetical protein
LPFFDSNVPMKKSLVPSHITPKPAPPRRLSAQGHRDACSVVGIDRIVPGKNGGELGTGHDFMVMF